jgi:hypothetical protein
MTRRYEDELVTKMLKVIDDEERVRAVIGSSDDGESELTLYDEAQRGRASIFVGRHGASMSLRDRNEGNRITAVMHDTRGANLFLSDRHGKFRVRVGEGEDGTVLLFLNNKEGEPRVVAIVEDDLPGIMLFDGKSDTSGVQIHANSEFGPYIAEVG